MPSPFPGMDPWLEADDIFPDLHNALIVYIRESLNGCLPLGYLAKGAQPVWVDDDTRREPDVSLLGTGSSRDGTHSPLALPGMIALGEKPQSDPWKQPYVEIVTPQGRRLVTAIEILSPSNKRRGDKGRTVYKGKQRELRRGGVNIVEIDLLRAGSHSTAATLSRLRRASGPFDYHVSVLVAGSPDRMYAAPIRLADRLPAVAVPLDPGVPPVMVDLQPLLDRCYDTGRYAAEVCYDRPADPPLTSDQQAWADRILREKGVLK